MNPQPSTPPAVDLDGDELASVLLRLVMISAKLGHQRPESTARDYCRGVTSPEARFVRDVLTLSTKEICEIWFGGVENAQRTIADLAETLIGGTE